MKIVFLTGSHPRHAYVARQLAATGFLSGLVIERREEHMPAPPSGLDVATRELFVTHFQGRVDAEARFFGHDSHLPDNVEVLHTSMAQLNGAEVQGFIERHAPDLLLSYGVHKLSAETLLYARGEKWNIHGGLSPWYRGAITHFWPHYLLEPQMTGMTVHELTEHLDGGDVVHQVLAPMVRGDGVHDSACRAVKACADELPRLVLQLAEGRPILKKRQTTCGRIWRGQDWHPAHLHVVYGLYKNRVIDAYLDGKLGRAMPDLHRQFGEE